MMEKSALAHSIYHHVQSCSVSSGWRGRDTPRISSLPYMYQYSVATTFSDHLSVKISSHVKQTWLNCSLARCQRARLLCPGPSKDYRYNNNKRCHHYTVWMRLMKLSGGIKGKYTVAAGLSNRPVARSHIAVGAMGLPPLHVVCGGAGQLWIPRTLCVMWIVLRAVPTLPSSTVQLPSASTSPSTHFVCLYTCYSYTFAAIFVYFFVHPRLHSSVDVQRLLQSYSYIFAAIFVYIFVHPRLHSSVDAQQCLYSTPILTYACGCTAVSTMLQLHFRGHFRVHFRTSTPTFICGRTCLCSLHSTLQRPITCLVFKVAKSAWLHFTHQTEISLFTTFYTYI
jgi:hypothetical protein